MSQSSDVGYLELIRSNANFRRIWIGDVASLLGDWFNAIALYILVRELTSSPLALGLVFITKTLPLAVASPFAGLLIDRFDRRRLMIASDLIRALLVLGFLLVDDPGEVWIIYLLGSLQMVVSALFIPARSASIPNITTERELLTANALSAATWSTLLAVGAALGGLVTAALGVRAVFLLDSLSYVVSAFFILRTTIPQATDRPPAGGAILRHAWFDIVAGWRHMWARPSIGRMALAKATWAVGGGGLVYMLALLGEKLHPAAPAVGMGVLYSARGLGTGIGPVVMRKFLPQERKWPAMMGLGIVASGVGYLFIGSISWSIVLAVVVVLAHAPSGANWVASSVLLQKRTEDRFRGRVFATEWLSISLVDSLSILGASLLLEWADVTLRTAILVFAAIQIICGVIWLLVVVPAERR
ncbi:MAG: MFS transporter [Thermoanaerobaculia bacterium]